MAKIDCLKDQNKHGFASRNQTKDGTTYWQQTKLFKVKWFRMDGENNIEIRSTNVKEPFSLGNNGILNIKVDSVAPETFVYCTWEYIGRRMQSGTCLLSFCKVTPSSILFLGIFCLISYTASEISLNSAPTFAIVKHNPKR